MRFEVGESENYSLGALETANFTQFALATGSTLTANSLTALEGSSIELDSQATLNATSVTSIRNSELTIAPDRTYNLGQLSEIDNARISVSGGVAYDNVTDSSYVNDRNANETIFSAEGSGSILDLSSLTSLTYGNGGGQRQKVVSASSGGLVDLSGVEVIDTVAGQDDLLDFRIESGGTVDLSSLQSINPTNGNGANRVRFEVSGGSSLFLGGLQTTSQTQIDLQDLDSTISLTGDFRLDPTSSITAAQGALLTVDGDFVLEQTDESLVNLDSAIVQIAGNRQGSYRLEVGGENLGVNQSTSDNFGFGQLVVGGGNNDVFVSLLDVVDNGNGPNGDPEALYLYGLGGPDGLRVLDGSILALNGIDVYAWDAVLGEQVHLNSLFTGGENVIEFDDGFLQLSGDPIPGDFDFDGDVDADDIDFYSQILGQPASFNPRLDLDNDGEITLADHDFHVNGFVQTTDGIGTLVGDVNLDGSVNVLDDAFVLVRNLDATSGVGYADGDLNADGRVDVLGDAFRLVGNLNQSTASSFAQSSSTSFSTSTSAVPEPSATWLLGLIGATLGIRRRR